MVSVQSLNVTQLEPRMKHPTVFKHFDELEPGENFSIENDHDPKPLYYELIAERGDIFTWEYLQKGPEWYVVNIAKKAVDTDGEETVGSIAAKDIRKAEILKAKGIDFCCGGNKSVKEASEEAGISETELREALNASASNPVSPTLDYNRWKLDFLADYIVNTHHQYVKDHAQSLNELANKVAEHHGDNHPELHRFSTQTYHFLQDLLDHLVREEEVLFPVIKQAVEKLNNPDAETNYQIGTLEQPINLLKKEHEIAGEDLNFFRRLTNDYALPANACNSYRFLFEKMKEFESDLLTHIHLENNILFPKALKLDQELAERAAAQ